MTADVSAEQERDPERHRELRRTMPSTLSAFVDSMPSATLLVDEHGTIRVANRVAARLFGLTPDTIAGLNVLVFLPEAPFLDRRGEPTIAMDGTPRAYPDLLARSRDGTDVRVDAGLTALEGAEGRLAIVAFCDVTRRARAEQEIVRLAADLRFRLEELGEAVRAKDLLLREVHHRVKNNLQIVSSLLSLQARRIEDRESRRVFEESRDRLASMSLVHEQLYRGTEHGRVDFAAYLRKLVAGIGEGQLLASGGVTLTVSADEASVALDVAVPVGMMVHELVTNSLKHAFEDRCEGSIHVSLARLFGGRLELAVFDDGDGYDPSVVKRGSFGRRLVELLARQVEAEMETRFDGGTHVFVRFADGIEAEEPV